MAQALIGLSLLFFLGHVLAWVFEKTKVPDLLVLVILGYLMGPIFGWVEPQDLGQVGKIVATFTLVIILFEGGLHLKAQELVKGTLPSGVLTVFCFVGTVVLSALLLKLFTSESLTTCTLVGLAIGSTSSAIVIPMVKVLSIQPQVKTILSLESAFTDVLAIVGFIVVLDAALAGVFDPLKAVFQLGPGSLVSLSFGAAAAVIWLTTRKYFEPIKRIAFSTEAFVVLTYGVIELWGFNGALSALALGFTLSHFSADFLKVSEQGLGETETYLLSEVTKVLKTFFFVYLGTLVDFKDLTSIALALLVSGAIFGLRYLAVRLFFRGESYNPLDRMILVSMGPRGLACAVLATLPLQRGYAAGGFVQSMVFTVIPMTILITAIAVAVSELKTRSKPAATPSSVL